MREWIEWNGGKQPVSDDTWVDVEFRCGHQYGATDPAEIWDWEHSDADYDIVAYRVVSYD